MASFCFNKTFPKLCLFLKKGEINQLVYLFKMAMSGGGAVPAMNADKYFIKLSKKKAHQS